MGVKIGILLITLLAGSFAVPSPDYYDSDLFYHTDPSARIVGGSQAVAGSVPYMVAMSSGVLIRSFMCGGSVINTRTVLTAAHCIDASFSWGSLASSLRVTVGTNRWNSGGQTYSLQRNVTHPNYVSSTIKNDLGLLITTSNIQYSNVVLPVALASEFIGNGVISRAAGWGRIRKNQIIASGKHLKKLTPEPKWKVYLRSQQNGALSATLLELTVFTIDGDRCVREVAAAAAAANMIAPPVEPHIELCILHNNGAGFGMCNGDSGSALVRVDNQQQIGIVSWGIPCARGAPDMFVRVSAYTSWIQANWV